MIKNAGLLLHKTDDGVSVAYDEDKLEALQQYVSDPQENLCFEIKAYARSPEFKSYSEPFSEASSKLLYFTNHSRRKAEGARVQLHPKAYVSRSDLVALDSEQLTGVLNREAMQATRQRK